MEKNLTMVPVQTSLAFEPNPLPYSVKPLSKAKDCAQEKISYLLGRSFMLKENIFYNNNSLLKSLNQEQSFHDEPNPQIEKEKFFS